MTYWLQSAWLRSRARQNQEQRSTDLRLFQTPRTRLTVALIATISVGALFVFAVIPMAQDWAADRDGDGIASGTANFVAASPSAQSSLESRPMRISLGTQVLSWESNAATVGGILGDAGLTVGAYDRLIVEGQNAEPNLPIASLVPATSASIAEGGAEAEAAPIEVDVQRAMPVTIIEDGQALKLHSTAVTLEEVLGEAGVRLGPGDRIYPSPATPVYAGMQVKVDHARTFTLHLGNTTRVLYTHEDTLEDALAEVGLTFGPEDRVEPPLGVPVTDGLEARVIRVTGRPIYESESVPHVTVFKPDDELSGIETKRVEGTAGTLVTEYRLVIEDGVEVEKTFVDRYYDPAPVDTVIYYAASALNSTEFSPPDHEVLQVMRLYGTWYNAASSGKPATHPAYGITRSGMPLTKGIVAVDPNVIPLGTHLYVPGYGFAVAGDTGGGIIGNRIDMGYPDGVEVDWITGWTDVYILEP